MSLVFVALLVVVNFIGITESVWMNMLMTFVEVAGLLIVLVIAIVYIAQGNADFGSLTEIDTSGDYGSPALAVLAGISFSFFAMTGFENTANVAEETIDPYKAFPRSLVGGMVVAGLVYVLVSMAAALTVPVETLANSDAALLEVVKQGILPVLHRVHDDDLLDHRARRDHQHDARHHRDAAARPLRHGPRGRRPRRLRQDPPGPPQPVGRPASSPAAVVASLLVIGTLVTEAGGGIDLVGRLATVTVVLLLAIYAIVIVACLKLRGRDEDDRVLPRQHAAARSSA